MTSTASQNPCPDLVGIKSSFFKIFPRGKFMTVADFCDDALLGKCVVLIHGGDKHKNYIGDSEKEKLAEHLRRGRDASNSMGILFF